MKSKSILLLLLIMLVVIGSSCEASFTTANYKDLEMARFEGEEVIYTDTFANDTPEVYVMGVLDNAPGTTNIKAEWYYLSDEEVFIDSAELEVEDLKTEFHFSLSIPDNGWPAGNYEVRLSIEGEHKETLEFNVESTTANYRDLGMARLEGEEVLYTYTFSTDTPEIYIIGVLENGSGVTKLKAEWYYVENEEVFIDLAEVETEESNTDFYFSLNVPDEGWPAGDYEVRLFIDGEHQKTVGFMVE